MAIYSSQEVNVAIYSAILFRPNPFSRDDSDLCGGG